MISKCEENKEHGLDSTEFNNIRIVIFIKRQRRATRKLPTGRRGVAWHGEGRTLIRLISVIVVESRSRSRYLHAT